jgi:hypothetical protein
MLCIDTRVENWVLKTFIAIFVGNSTIDFALSLDKQSIGKTSLEKCVGRYNMLPSIGSRWESRDVEIPSYTKYVILQ